MRAGYKATRGEDPAVRSRASVVNGLMKPFLGTHVLMLVFVCLQLLQPGEAGLETVRNMTLNGDVEVRLDDDIVSFPSVGAKRSDFGFASVHGGGKRGQ